VVSINSTRYHQLLNRLIQARKQAGLTQAEVANKLHKPQSFVSKIESGEKKIDFTEIEDLSRIYHVSLSFFNTDVQSITES